MSEVRVQIERESDIVLARQAGRQLAAQLGFTTTDQTLIAIDNGPGIDNKDLAMRDGYSTKNSLGLGLPGARRLMDDFALESEVGRGTTVTMKKWKR